MKPGRPVKDISIKKEDSIKSIFDQMSKSGGFDSMKSHTNLPEYDSA